MCSQLLISTDSVMCFSKTTDIYKYNEDLPPGNLSQGGIKRSVVSNEVDFDVKAESVHSSSKTKG